MATLRPPVALRPVDSRTSIGTQLLQGSPVDRSRLSSPPSHHFRGCCRVAAARHHRWVQKNQCKSIRLWSPTADWAQSAAAPTPKSRTVSSNLRANKCVAGRTSSSRKETPESRRQLGTRFRRLAAYLACVASVRRRRRASPRAQEDAHKRQTC